MQLGSSTLDATRRRQLWPRARAKAAETRRRRRCSARTAADELISSPDSPRWASACMLKVDVGQTILADRDGSFSLARASDPPLKGQRGRSPLLPSAHLTPLPPLQRQPCSASVSARTNRRHPALHTRAPRVSQHRPGPPCRITDASCSSQPDLLFSPSAGARSVLLLLQVKARRACPQTTTARPRQRLGSAYGCGFRHSSGSWRRSAFAAA